MVHVKTLLFIVWSSVAMVALRWGALYSSKWFLTVPPCLRISPQLKGQQRAPSGNAKFLTGSTAPTKVRSTGQFPLPLNMAVSRHFSHIVWPLLHATGFRITARLKKNGVTKSFNAFILETKFSQRFSKQLIPTQGNTLMLTCQYVWNKTPWERNVHSAVSFPTSWASFCFVFLTSDIFVDLKW